MCDPESKTKKKNKKKKFFYPLWTNTVISTKGFISPFFPHQSEVSISKRSKGLLLRRGTPFRKLIEYRFLRNPMKEFLACPLFPVAKNSLFMKGIFLTVILRRLDYYPHCHIVKWESYRISYHTRDFEPLFLFSALSLFCLTSSLRKFPGQKSNPRCSYRLHHGCDNTRSLTHFATKELPLLSLNWCFN